MDYDYRTEADSNRVETVSSTDMVVISGANFSKPSTVQVGSFQLTFLTPANEKLSGELFCKVFLISQLDKPSMSEALFSAFSLHAFPKKVAV